MAWCRDEKIPWATKHFGGTTIHIANEILSQNVQGDLTNKCSQIFVLSCLGFCLEISNFPSMGSAL